MEPIHILNIFKTYPETLPLELLCGDMSYKRFYRLRMPEKNYILIQIPTSGSASIEIFSRDNQLSLSPTEAFIDTALILHKHIANVSCVHAFDKEAGLILLDDHGDILFDEFLKNNSSKNLLKSFEKLFIWLGKFQQSQEILPKDFFALQRVFEKNALLEELEEYVDFGLQQYEQKNLNDFELKTIKQDFNSLAVQIANQPLALIHRDFQSKNIMIQAEDFWVIDYQDLCLGPYCYDYASIIFDPYLNLSFDLQKQLIKISWEMNFQSEFSFETYLKDIKHCAKQRLLKAAGRYAKHFCLNQKDSHLKYYQPACDKILELNL